MKVWTTTKNNHLGYEQVEVISETKYEYKTVNKTIHKDNAFYREIDVINALIARNVKHNLYYEEKITFNKSQIKQLVERKKYI